MIIKIFADNVQISKNRTPVQPIFSGSPWKMCAHQKEQTSNAEKMAPREQAVQDRKDGRIPGLMVKARPRTTAEK